MIRNTVRIFTVLCALCLFASVSFAQQTGGDKSKKGATASDTTAKKAPKAKPVDINSATEDELAAVPGMPTDAPKKIVDGRPYKTKRDLLTKKIVSADDYKTISPHIVAHHAAGAEKKSKKGAASTPPPK
jgi:competence protein ComEA